jgi:glycosyltransferase involved in cell wall biosynthesis
MLPDRFHELCSIFMTIPRIAYLAGSYPAVTHTFILREVAALRKQGLDIVTYSVRRPGPEQIRSSVDQAEAENTFNVLETAKKPGVLIRAQVRALKQPGLYLRTLRKAWSLRGPGLRATVYQLFYFLEATVLAQHLKAQGATHLHNHFAQASCTVALLAARLAGIPFSFTLHGPADFTDPKLWKLDAKISDAIFVACISHYCRSQAMLASPVEDWAKLHIIHCGVEPARYDAPPATGQGLLFVGRLAAAKGVPVLIEVMPRILSAYPDAQLTLIGDGPDRARLQDQVHRLGLSGAVHFAGYQNQEEVAEALARAAIFVLPSFAEGVPVVLMEAMAARRPVVATHITGIPELVEDGASGRIVAPGDAAAFAKAVCDILAAPNQATTMGEAGRRKVKSEFDVACEAVKLAALFRKGSCP